MSGTMDFATQRALEMRASFERLLQRLQAQSQIALLDEAELETFIAAAGDGMVLLTQEPEQQPETWDVAVILPEVLKQFRGRLRAAIVSPELARQQKVRFGITRWPALLFVRDGAYVGAIEGMCDWEIYQREVAAMLEKPAGRSPSIGIAVLSGAAASCH